MTDHPIVHIEFSSKVPSEASQFYADLFGWEMTSMQVEGYGDYHTFSAQEGLGGGFPLADGQGTRPGDVVVYVDTKDISASLAKAAELGATTIMPKTELPNVGWIAIFLDPTGNKVGLWENLQTS